MNVSKGVNMGRKKILIVDDEKGFTNMLSLNLESTGDYEVCVENEAVHAMESVCQFNPDLILLDVVMPNLEGPDVARQIRNNKDFSDIPILFLTATVTKEEVDQSDGCIGGNSFVAKPSSLEDLLGAIRKNIEESSELG